MRRLWMRRLGWPAWSVGGAGAVDWSLGGPVSSARAVLLVVLPVIWSCSSDDPPKETPPPTDTSVPRDTGDSGPPADTGEAPIAYITYEGTLAYLYGMGKEAVRDYDCKLYWDIDPAVDPVVLEGCPNLSLIHI